MNFKKSTTLLFSLLLAGSAMAIPAKPGFTKIKQPDGTVITVKLCGDEKLNWFETEDGYKLLRNKDNYLTYAVNNTAGDLVPSAIVYGASNDTNIRRAALNISKNAEFSQSQIESAMKRMPMSTEGNAIFPNEGKCNLLMVLVNFSDTKITTSQEEINNMMNQEGYNNIGSFRDFMLEASGGKLDITTTVTEWITIDKKHDDFYYIDSNTNVGDMIMAALKKADESIDFSKFDNNKDGYVDGIMILHQGYGQESSGDKNDIWSHSHQLQYLGIAGGARKFDGVYVNAYTIEPELIYTYDSKPKKSTIGVFCHEFTHNMGAADFYDADGFSGGGNFDGTGNWDLMASGSWNGDQGDRPAMINAYERIRLGWLPTPTELTEDTKIENLKYVTESKQTYRINTGNKNDYFILENRQQSKSNFDQAIPGNGLLIYHVNQDFYNRYNPTNRINSTKDQSVYVVAANATSDPASTPASFGSINSKTAIFGNSNIGGFNRYTYPSNKAWDGTKAQGELYDIKNNGDGTVSFTFCKEKTFEFKDITPEGNRGKYTLNFNGPAVDKGTIHGYNVYLKKKGEWSLYTTTKDNSITFDIRKLKGEYNYGFAISFDNGTSSEILEYSFFVPEECLTNVEVIENGRSNTINWTVDESKKNGQGTKFVEYRIYRNNEVIGKTTSTTFTDNSPLEKAKYTVVSVWDKNVELEGLTTKEATDIDNVAENTVGNIVSFYDNQSESFICNIISQNTGSNAVVEIYNTIGQKITEYKSTLEEGLNTLQIQPNKETEKGVYIITVILKDNEQAEHSSNKVIVM